MLVLDILFFFQRNGIKSLINLQHPGEHSSCGFGLEPVSGFSYIPEHFMQEDSMCNSSISISDIIIITLITLINLWYIEDWVYNNNRTLLPNLRLQAV